MNNRLLVDFHDTETAFRDQPSASLKRAYWMFSLLRFPVLVKWGERLLQLVLWLRLPISWAVKPTIFRHFCGGERIDECDTAIERLHASGVFTILDYSAEGMEKESFYNESEQQVLRTIEKASQTQAIPFAVFKPSGVARAELLEKMQMGERLSAQEQAEWARARNRFYGICSKGVALGVPVMIDAEEFSMQTIVDELVWGLMRKYNKERPMVFTTLQMYRKDRLDYLRECVQKSNSEGFKPGFKLVRGAYLEKERELAKNKEQASPVFEHKHETDDAFDSAVALCLENIEGVDVCIATHNEDSCTKALEHMQRLGIESNHPNVSFAQLLGMSDHISYNLATIGYVTCKYVPYGPVRTVMPYLIRRAQENTSVAGQTSRELFLIKEELKRRKARA